MALCLVEVLPEHRPGRGRWWRPKAEGYTDRIWEAGVFDEADPRCHLGVRSRSRVVPLTDAEVDTIEMMQTAHAGLLGVGVLPDPLVGELLARHVGLARLLDLTVSA